MSQQFKHSQAGWKSRLIRSLRLHDRFCSPSQWAYHHMLKERDGSLPRNFSSVQCDGVPGLVSIILPVYNGMAYLSEAIDSVLQQHYQKWELIVVDDGSTDESAEIARRFVEKDTRIRYIYQENQKLPAALNRGHACARGEFITWTSDDNRLKETFLSVLVEEMTVRPSVDMLYANMEVIDSAGQVTSEHNYYKSYESSSQKGLIALPSHVSMLHVWNCIGAAFLYRRRVTALLGAYSRHWYLCEDYDFFLRVNAQMILRHSRCQEALYQYRVHEKSLTSVEGKSLIDSKMEALQLYDDSRRDLLSGPMGWQLIHDEGAESIALYEKLKELIEKQGHYCLDACPPSACHGAPTVLVCLCSGAPSSLPRENTAHTARVLIHCGDSRSISVDNADYWSLELICGDMRPRGENSPRSGLLATSEPECLFHLIHAHGTAAYGWAQEKLLAEPEPDEEEALDLSVLVCTNRPPEFCERALRSLMSQSHPASRYEVLLINNDPRRYSYSDITASLALEDGPTLREIIALPRGLSCARNVGAASARGRVLLYMDDDAEADHHLVEKIVAAYTAHPHLGAAGGAILLAPPSPAPWWWGVNLAAFWSELRPDTQEVSSISNWLHFPYGANLSIRRRVLQEIGGFRSRYGPGGRKVQWGDDTLACMQIFQAGYDIAIVPDARVQHHIDPKRFSLRLLFRMGRQSYGTMVLMMQEKRLPVKMNFVTAFLRAVIRLGLVALPWPRSISWRVEQAVLSRGLFHASRLLFLGLLGSITTGPPESKDL